MNDTDYLNILAYGKPQGTIELKPYPDDILEVDPKIIASMKARLKGESFSTIYDVSDRIIDELALEREKKKLLKVFRSTVEISVAFSCVKNINIAREEMSFEEVNRELLKDYSLVVSRGEYVDEVDFLKSFLYGDNLKAKIHRKINYEPFHVLNDEYQNTHFDIIKISKEAIEMSSALSHLFKQRRLVTQFDEFLSHFYGMSR